MSVMLGLLPFSARVTPSPTTVPLALATLVPALSLVLGPADLSSLSLSVWTSPSLGAFLATALITVGVSVPFLKNVLLKYNVRTQHASAI